MDSVTEARVVPEAVDEEALLRSLARVRGGVLDANVGLFGPTTVFWEVNRHTLVYFLGALQSVMMHLVHPWIATAVAEHSKIVSDPRRRAQLTYTFLWSFIYGDLDLVCRRAIGLYRMHGRVLGRLAEDAGRHREGDPYAANEVRALLWVHVTAFVGRVRFYELLVRPLTQEEKDRFVREAMLYGFCFGIPDSVHPQTWTDVEAYLARMVASDELGRTAAGVRIRRVLALRVPRPFRAPLFELVDGTLPDRVRAALDVPVPTERQRRWARSVGRVLGRLQRRLPASLAYVPAYHEATRRIAGERGADATTRLLNRLVLGVPTLVSRA